MQDSPEMRESYDSLRTASRFILSNRTFLLTPAIADKARSSHEQHWPNPHVGIKARPSVQYPELSTSRGSRCGRPLRPGAGFGNNGSNCSHCRSVSCIFDFRSHFAIRVDPSEQTDLFPISYKRPFSRGALLVQGFPSSFYSQQAAANRQTLSLPRRPRQER